MNPIIFALDYSSIKEAHAILKKIKSSIGMIKIGMELYNNYGPHCLELGKVFDLPIFLDLKLCDIPNAVERTVKSICNISERYKIEFLTIHSSGGKDMIKSAVNAANGSSLKIAAVSLLTSLDRSDLCDIGYENTVPSQQGLKLAILAKTNGVSSFVCSPYESKELRMMIGNNDEIICPGIRFNQEKKQDQKRASSPLYALQNGASRIVVGRTISNSYNPKEMAQKILNDLDK